jgi:hypothetical protein
MMKDMVGCAVCDQAYASQGKHVCPACGSTLISFNVTENAWDSMNLEEKNIIKEKALGEEKAKLAARDRTYFLEIKINQMARDTRMIRNILLISIITNFFLFFISLGR